MDIFDCTLRDGANVVGNGFSAELTVSMIEGLLSCGINSIEFGNAKGLGAYNKLNATAPLNDEQYMDLVSPYVLRCNLGMFQLAKLISEETTALAKEKGLHFLRVGIDAGDGAKAIDAVKTVKAAGLTCRFSMMKAYLLSPTELAEEAELLQDNGVDCITIMDSAGYMMPHDTTAYVKALKERLHIPVGFHGHNNLGLSQANAISATLAGADEIDCGLLGMARSAGNCATELTVVGLQRIGMLQHVNLLKLLSYLDADLIPRMDQYNYRPAVKPVDLILGQCGCHSSFLNIYKEVSKEIGISLYPLIMAVSSVNKKDPDIQHIRAIAKSIHDQCQQ